MMSAPSATPFVQVGPGDFGQDFRGDLLASGEIALNRALIDTEVGGGPLGV